MASLISDPNGRKRIGITLPDGTRQSIRLGKMEKSVAKHVLWQIERLEAARVSQAMPPDLAAWLDAQDEVIYGRLVAVGLAEPRAQHRATLGELAQAFVDGLDVKPSTLLVVGQARRSLESFFGAGTALRTITPQRADEWAASLRAEDLATATISKRITLARSMFRKAFRFKWISDNPFEHLVAGSMTNPKRLHFVTDADARRVLEACPDNEWRLIFSLARWGALRCPSEVGALRWADVDFANGRIVIRSTKTEGEDHGGVRIIPLFAELQSPLMEAFHRATPVAEGGSEYVVTRTLLAATNLRTTMLRIIERAGLTPWPRTFQNLRATRATELARLFPSHVAAAWCGHTEQVAMEHYRSVTEDDFARALAMKPVATDEATQKATRTATEQGGTDVNPLGDAASEITSIPVLVAPVRSVPEAVEAGVGFEPTKPCGSGFAIRSICPLWHPAGCL